MSPREVPIIFSAAMVRANNQGRKTNTRRLAWVENGAVTVDYGRKLAAKGWRIDTRDSRHSYAWRPSPWQRLKAGDRLWVREAWKPHSIYAGMKPRDIPQSKVFYLADDSYEPSNTPGLPSIHMPRWASRTTLIVTSTKVEPLWNISEADCEAEGIVFETADPPFWYVPYIMPHSLTAVGIEERGDLMPRPVQCFRKLWMLLHGREGWDANPDVVAISYRVIQANIDAPEARIAA
jgi:hypothetical protein